MYRKAVTRHLETITKLRPRLRMASESLDQRLAQRPVVVAGEGASYRPLFELWDGELAGVQRQLESAENAYVQDKYRLRTLRKDRDQTAFELHGEQTRFQSLLRALLEPDVLAMAGIGGAVPKGGIALVRRAESTVNLVHDLAGACRWPLAGVGIEAGGVAKVLEAGRRKLFTAIREVKGGEQDVAASQDQADRALAEADRIVPPITRVLESLYQLAGDHRRADRILSRLSRGRSR